MIIFSILGSSGRRRTCRDTLLAMNDIERFLPLLVPFVAGTLSLALSQNSLLTLVLFVVTGVTACALVLQGKR